MAKRHTKGIDIHHPNMVKTVFIMTSLGILALLILIVKYTSFKSEPEAAVRKKDTFTKSLTKNLSVYSTWDNACLKYFNQNYPNYHVHYAQGGDVFAIGLTDTCGNFASFFHEGYLPNDTGGMEDVRCCVNLNYIYTANDLRCGGQVNLSLRCKPNCNQPYGNDLGNQYSYTMINTSSFNTICDTANPNTSALSLGDINQGAGNCCLMPLTPTPTTAPQNSPQTCINYFFGTYCY